jgi:hypothetical protein
MSQRPNNDNLNDVIDSLQKRIEALERQSNQVGPAQTITDISNLATGNALAIKNLPKSSSSSARLTYLESMLPVVTVLPTTGLVDNMVVNYRPAIAASYGVTWPMKYFSTPDALGYHWNNIGGEPISSWVLDTGYKIPNGAFGQLENIYGYGAFNVQDITIPATGEWTIEGHVSSAENHDASSSTYFFMQPAVVSGTNAETSYGTGKFASSWLLQYPNGTSPAGGSVTNMHMIRTFAIVKDSVVGLRYFTGSTQVSVSGKMFRVKPVRM